jgi:hypothetical protein
MFSLRGALAMPNHDDHEWHDFLAIICLSSGCFICKRMFDWQNVSPPHVITDASVSERYHIHGPSLVASTAS